MAYIPVVFFLFAALTGYATTLDPRPSPARVPGAPLGVRSSPWARSSSSSAVGYAGDRGYASLKRRFSLAAYLPDEAAEFEGFYRPETRALGRVPLDVPAGDRQRLARRAVPPVVHLRPPRRRERARGRSP